VCATGSAFGVLFSCWYAPNQGWLRVTLILGFLLITLSCALLGLVLARTLKMERLASERLAALAEANAELKTLQESSRGQLRFLVALINALPNPLFYKDTAGVFRLCNKRFAGHVLGLSIDRILGHTVQGLPDAIPAPLAELFLRCDEELLQQGKPQAYAGPVRCHDGIVREFHFNKAIFKKDRGEPEGIIGVMVDVNDLPGGE
jgi:hypothetical protein